MTFAQGGNIGIGTMSPGGLLHIVSTAGADKQLRITDGGTEGTNQARFEIGYESSYGRMQVWKDAVGALPLSLQNSGGNVGIGTTAPTHKLHVIGTAGLSTGTAWTNTSDIRLKDVEGDYEYGLAQVKKLHTIRFKYKKNNPLGLPSEDLHTGFIAQEVRQLIPDAVMERADGYLELNVDPIHWATVNAVKELAEEKDLDVAQLHERLAKAEAENAALRSRADKAEADAALFKAALCAKFGDLDGCS